MIARVAGVLLDADEAAYVARALDLLAQLLAGQRSQPSARLAAVTTKLRKASEPAGACGRSDRTTARFFAPQRDSVDDPTMQSWAPATPRSYSASRQRRPRPCAPEPPTGSSHRDAVGI